MLGTVLSAFPIGFLADRFGRKVVVMWQQVAITMSTLLLPLMSSLPLILLLRFIIGCTETLTIMVLALEVCKPSIRIVVGMASGVAWALGTVWWALLGYWLRHWRWLQLVGSLPNLLLLAFVFMLDESPRWLMIKGHDSQARKVLARAARWNKTQLPSQQFITDVMQDIRKQESEVPEMVNDKPGQPDSTIKGFCRKISKPKLFSTRSITTITLAVFCCYLAAAMIFDGLNYSGDLFGGDPFLYMGLNGLVEVPALIIGSIIVLNLGRKMSSIIFFVIVSVTQLALAFLNIGTWVPMVLVVTGKMFITAAFQTLYIYSSELFPTEVRATGVDTASAVGQIGAVMCPYIIIYLGPRVPWVPSVVFCILAAVAAVATMFLRETSNAALPHTIAELDNHSPSNETEVTKL